MKTCIILTLVSSCLATGAVASPRAAPKGKAPKTELHCAVQPDDKVNIKDATKKKMFADYKGNRYFFCCAGCPEKFKKNPAKYAKGDHIPAPKASKKPL